MEELDNDIFANRVNLDGLKEALGKIKSDLSKVIVGQTKMIDLLLTAILADGHVLLEGVPGVAKTLTAKTFSKSLDIPFSRIQFTPDLMPSDVLGTTIFNQKTSEFEFRKGPIFSSMILIDEINRSPAKTQAALFEVMEEKQITVDGTTYPMQEPFIVIATQNPVEQEGTYRLPEAQLDRFSIKINIDYPTLEEETSILRGINKKSNAEKLADILPVIQAQDIMAYRKLVEKIHVDDHLITYIAQLVGKTRNNHSLYLGGSTRASLAILKCSKAYAAIQGRDFITPEDIKAMTIPVLNHRLIVSPEKEMEGIVVGDVINQIIHTVEVPR